MSKIRIIESTDPNIECDYFLCDHKLSLKAKGLMAMMIFYPERDDFILAEFALYAKESEDSIRSTFTELEEIGYLERWQGRNELGQMLPIEYNLFMNPNESGNTTEVYIELDELDDTELEKEVEDLRKEVENATLTLAKLIVEFFSEFLNFNDTDSEDPI